MGSGTKDFNLELFLRAKYLERFLKECGHVRVRDLCIIFDSANCAESAVNCLNEGNDKCCKVFGRLRKIEFSHSPFENESEFAVARKILGTTTKYLNRFRIDDFRTLVTIN